MNYKYENLVVAYGSNLCGYDFNNFAQKFSQPIQSQRLLMDSMGRATVINKIRNFIKNNISKFEV